MYCIYTMCSLCFIIYVCVYTGMSYACMCMCMCTYMCICMCVHINKIIQTVRLDQINPSGCDTAILLQDVLSLFVQEHSQQSNGSHRARTMTDTSGHTYHVFCSTEILLQKQRPVVRVCTYVTMYLIVFIW